MLNPYFLGGIDDMTAWTRYIWKDVIHMLEHDVGYVILLANGICARRSGVFTLTDSIPILLSILIWGLLTERVITFSRRRTFYKNWLLSL